jgi:hypothetical protein
VTASELHHLFANTGDPSEQYDAGFESGPAFFRAASEGGETSVDFSVHVSTGGMCTASVYRRLEPAEARELAGALERAAAAAERSREIEIEESRDA